MSSYLDGLNNAQLDAVRTTEGAVRVLAGAGTGKTRALTARYCYLVNLLGIDPASILCVTFTNKAAAEMKTRIRRRLGDVDMQYVCTFHSWCARMLREDIHVLNYPSEYLLLDEEDRKEVLQKVYIDLGITLKELPIRRAVEYIGERKSREGYMAVIETLSNPLPAKAEGAKAADRMGEIYARYLYEQKKTFALDYDDLIIFAHYILKNYPEVARKWQGRMEYVMVDEFQDVSRRQYDIASILAGRHGNLFIVGDPDQAIYTWRGARVELILDFDKAFAGCTSIVMDDNYRSTPEILRVSNSLIAHNRNRYPKSLRAHAEAGPLPHLYHGRNDRDEAQWVARRIAEEIRGGTPPRQIAVLYRAHHVSRPLEDVFIKRGINYVIYSGTAFYSRREVKDTIAYLRMLVYGDDLSFLRTFNTPSRRMGTQKLNAIRANAEARGLSLYESLQELAATPAFARTGAKAYIDTIEGCRELVGKVPLGDLVQAVVERSGYEELLRGLSEWERIDNLAELKRAVEEAGHDDDATLEQYLRRVALVTNLDAKAERDDAIRMMTVHTAKGMEFDTVFVCGMAEGSFPSKRSTGVDDIEEERRLAYVAFTRARKRLMVSDAEGYGHDRTERTPSRFIYEAGPANFDIERPLPEQAPVAAPMAGDGEKLLFAPGDRVEHPVFGPGTVTSVDNDKYTVAFDRLGTERSLRPGAPLDKI